MGTSTRLLGPQCLEAGGTLQGDTADGRGGPHVEANPVAFLDRLYRCVLVAPGERPDDREAGADPRDLGGEEGEAAGDQRTREQWPEPVDEDRRGTVLGQRGGGASPREQLRDRGARVGASAKRQADPSGEHPPGDGDERKLRLRGGRGGEHGDERERSGDAGREQDGGLEELGEAHVLTI